MLTGDMLRRSAERVPDKTAIIFQGTRVSYRDLDSQANQFAHAMLELNLAKGAKVAILSRNRTEYATIFFGAARTGAVLVNVSVLYALEELVYVLEKADVEVLIYEDVFAEKVLGAAESLPKLKYRIVIGERQGKSSTFESFLRGQRATNPSIPLDENDPFCMTYTGGTTGRPKGVLANHRSRAVTAHTALVESFFQAEDGIRDDLVTGVQTCALPI